MNTSEFQGVAYETVQKGLKFVERMKQRPDVYSSDRITGYQKAIQRFMNDERFYIYSEDGVLKDKRNEWISYYQKQMVNFLSDYDIAKDDYLKGRLDALNFLTESLLKASTSRKLKKAAKHLHLECSNVLFD